MATNVLFSRGSSVNFASVTKDPNTLYFLNDTHEIYLGGEKFGFGQDITIAVTGVGDTVSNVSFDASTKTLTLVLGDAADAASVIEAIKDAVAACVKTVSAEAGSAILVDSSDPENIKLSLNIADEAHSGNVTLEECSDGLRASVDIPEAPIKEVAAGEKVIKLERGVLSSQLSITTVKEGGSTFVVLKGINGQDISRFDAAEFVKDGMLDSVSLKYSSDGLNHRILVMTFNTDAGKSDIELDIQDLISVYKAAENGGLKEGSDNDFSIANEVTPSDGPINHNVTPGFGDTITLKAVKYDTHGLITGVGDFTFTMPAIIGGELGGAGKLMSRVTLDADGNLTGATIDIVTALSSASGDTQIPTAKSVWRAIEDAKTVWETI